MLAGLFGVLLAANAASLGWGLRGEWGHWWGATVPGALCAMSLWIAFGAGEGTFQMLAYGAVMAVALSLGGILSYGLILGYATAERGRDQRSVRFGLLALFLVGGLWGFFGGTGLGLIVSDTVHPLGEMSLWAVIASSGALVSYRLLVEGLELHLSPPRSDAWAALLGAAAATCVHFAFLAPDMTVLLFAIVGWLGFGAGFSLGALVHREGNRAGFDFSSWKFMEHNVGFFGGLALGAAVCLVGEDLPVIQLGEGSRLVILATLWFVTYMVLANNMERWTFETMVIPRGVFSLCNFIALASLLILLWFAVDMDGQAHPLGQRGVFLLLTGGYTLIGIAKFASNWSALRSKVVITFVVQYVICAFLVFSL